MRPFSFLKSSGAPPVFDPATLALSGWWRASYAGSPWTPTASAGGSGSNGNLTEGTNPPSTSAGTVNGYTGADFDGVNDVISNATAITTMVSDSSGSLVSLFNADTAFADPGSTSFYLEPSLISSATSRLAMGFSTAGVSLGTYNGGGWNSIRTACATGGWHLAQARWNTTDIEVRVDSGSWVTTARALVLAGGSVQVGQNYDVGFFDGKILETMTAPARLSDTDFANLVSYVDARYALSL